MHAVHAASPVLASVFVFTSLAALGAPDAGAPVTLATLEQARATLAAAVKRIEVDPPSVEDLDAAHAAVGALRDTIDAGAANEQADLDYARAALAARKELRTQRDYVDQRRAKVHIHEHRRKIDEALAALKARMETLESAADFDAARAAVKDLKAALDAGRQFVGQDQKFAAYVADGDALAGKQLKAVDDRANAQLADRQRGVVEEARKALADAMAVLNKNATDAQFEAADHAAKDLTKRLEEGKPAEGDKSYRPVADKARAELAQSRKKMDELWSETGLARLKAEIEPAAKDLAAAGRAIRGRKPTDEALAEARTAAIVVRKLVDKFQPEAERSKAFGDWVATVKVSLEDVESTLELRTLDAARADVMKSLRFVEGLNPKDEHFDECASATLVLEKTLETVHQKNPAMVQPAADAKQLVHDARLTVSRRRTEVAVERLRTKIEAARNVATTKLDALLPTDLTKERIDDAEAAVQAVAKELEAGAELVSKSRDYAAYDREVRKRVAEGTARIAARRVNLAGLEGRALVTELIASAKLQLDTARQPAATDADLDAANKSVEMVGKALEDRAALEQQNGGYAAHAERSRVQLARLQETLELVRQGREVRKKTGDALSAGLAIENTAGAGDLRAQKAQHEKALALFKSCKEDGTALITSGLSPPNLVVLVDGRRTNPGDVIAECGKRIEATALLIKPLAALISFDEGPKRAYEKATALLSQGKKKEALAEFDECTATAMTVQYRNPDLRERSFEVGGAQMTLAELVKKCSAQSRALLGK